MSEQEYAGGTWLNGALYTWGTELRRWRTAQHYQVLTRGPFRFGCVFDGKLVLEREGTLRWGDTVIDTGMRSVDAAEARLFGRSGLLVVHLGMQLRFYEPPEAPAARWPYREIYSFYTNSEQGGLLLRDVDRDGRADILCGNYWVQCPDSFEQPWRLFAINLFHEHPLSASARLTWYGNQLLWLESKRPDARVRLFQPPANPKELWREQALNSSVRFQFPRAVLNEGGRLLIGENNGEKSRLLEFPGARTLLSGTPIHTLLRSPFGLIAIGPERVLWL